MRIGACHSSCPVTHPTTKREQRLHYYLYISIITDNRPTITPCIQITTTSTFPQECNTYWPDMVNYELNCRCINSKLSPLYQIHTDFRLSPWILANRKWWCNPDTSTNNIGFYFYALDRICSWNRSKCCSIPLATVLVTFYYRANYIFCLKASDIALSIMNSNSWLRWQTVFIVWDMTLIYNKGL